MNGLEQAFYIFAIVFMSLMLILVTALVVTVFVIRSKIMKIQRQIEDRIDSVTDLASKGGEMAARIGSKLARGAADKVKKAAGKTR